MEEICYFCGKSSDKGFLFDAVVEDGVEKVCESCSKKENVPLVRSGQADISDNRTNYERLSDMAGLDPTEHKSKFGPEEKKKGKEDFKKNIQEKNDLSFPNLNQFQAEQKEDLIRNFHWSILKARRAQGHTYKTLAKAISEDEQTVRTAERGVLPENYHSLIKKIQLALGITLFKAPEKSKNEVTLADLREKQRKMEEKGEVPESLQGSEAEGDTEGSEESSIEEGLETKVPYWKRILNLFKSRKKRRSEGPFEVPAEEVEEDLNLAKTEDLSNSQQEVVSQGPVEENSKNPIKEKVKSSLSGLESLRRRKTQKSTFSEKASSASEERKATSRSSSSSEGGEKASESSGSEFKEQKSSETSQSNQEKKDPENKKDSKDSSESGESKDLDDLSDEDIDKIIFGGK